MVNIKIYDVKTWLGNNWNTHIAQYLTNEMQLGNEILSVNRIYHKKNFPSKTMQKMSQGD